MSENKFKYNSEKYTLSSPCPICGEEIVTWDNVSESGIYYCWGDEIPCKPSMNKECEVCDSQIHFDTNITKDELIKWIEMNLKFIKHIKNTQ